jgi:hypothetical protein
MGLPTQPEPGQNEDNPSDVPRVPGAGQRRQIEIFTVLAIFNSQRTAEDNVFLRHSFQIILAFCSNLLLRGRTWYETGYRQIKWSWKGTGPWASLWMTGHLTIQYLFNVYSCSRNKRTPVAGVPGPMDQFVEGLCVPRKKGPTRSSLRAFRSVH